MRFRPGCAGCDRVRPFRDDTVEGYCYLGDGTVDWDRGGRLVWRPCGRMVGLALGILVGRRNRGGLWLCVATGHQPIVAFRENQRSSSFRKRALAAFSQSPESFSN